MGEANYTYLPPIDPYTLPAGPFDNLITQYGVRIQWMQSHQCACMWGGDVPGSPNPQCKTCYGRGVWWNPPSSVFMGLLTQMHRTPSPDEAGVSVDSVIGWSQNAQPILSIPATAGEVWQQASDYDAFIELDALTRYRSELTVGGIQSVPYQQNLSIAPSGAVTIWNTQTQAVQFVNYAVDGPNVILSGYPAGTSYVVEYTAAPVYVAFRKAGGMPHIRPFGGGVVSLPRRFHLTMLDVWSRSRNGTDMTPNNPNVL